MTSDRKESGVVGLALGVALTVVVVGGLAGVAMSRMLDRTNPNRVTEDGAVVEPIFESPTPEPTGTPEPEAPVPAPVTSQRHPIESVPTQEPAVVVVPHDTPSSTDSQQHEEEEYTDTQTPDSGDEEPPEEE